MKLITTLKKINILTLILAVLIVFASVAYYLELIRILQVILTILIIFSGYVFLNLFPSLRMRLSERLVLGFILSFIISTLIAGYMSLMPGHIRTRNFLVFSFLLLIASVIKDIRSKKTLEKKIGLNLKKELITLAIMVLIYVFALLFPIEDILKINFYYSLDPWATDPNVYQILNFQRKISETAFYGYYFLVAFVSKLTGLSVFFLTRHLGAFLLGILATTIYLIALRLHRNAIAILAPIFFIFHPYVINRFIMPLRENLSLVFFSAFLLILIILWDQMKNIRWSYLWLTAPIFSSIFLTSQIIFAITFITLFILTFLYIIRRFIMSHDWEFIKEVRFLFFTIVLGFLLAIINIVPAIRTGQYLFGQLPNYQLILFGIILLFLLAFVFAVYLLIIRKRDLDNNVIHLPLQINFKLRIFIASFLILFLIVLAFGFVYSFVNPPDHLINQFTGEIKPTFKSENFLVPTILFALLALIILLIKKVKFNFYFLFLLSLFFAITIFVNLSNIGLNLPIFRLSLYLGYFLALMGSAGAIYFISFLLKKSKKAGLYLIATIFFLIAINQIPKLTEVKGAINYSDNDLIFIKEVTKMIGEEKNIGDIIIIAPRDNFIKGLFYYTKVGDYSYRDLKEIIDDQLVKENLFEIVSDTQIKKRIGEVYPDKRKAYIVILQRKDIQGGLISELKTYNQYYEKYNNIVFFINI